jgi:hypothetical protein
VHLWNPYRPEKDEYPNAEEVLSVMPKEVMRRIVTQLSNENG